MFRPPFDLFCSGFKAIILHAFPYLSHASYRLLQAYLPWFDHSNYILEDRSYSCTLFTFVQSPVTSSCYVQVFSSRHCSQTSSLIHPRVEETELMLVQKQQVKLQLSILNLSITMLSICIIDFNFLCITVQIISLRNDLDNFMNYIIFFLSSGGSCEYGNELPDSIKGADFLE
jgi:hypothetical protein